MRYYTMLLLCCCTLPIVMANGQSKDKLLFSENNYAVYQKTGTKTYYLKKGNKIIQKDLRFCRSVGNGFQVIDENGAMYFLDEKLKRKNTLKPTPFLLCGTVADYELRIKETADHFIIFQRETYFNRDGKIPPREMARISKKDADRVFFLNKKTVFNFTGDFNIGKLAKADPSIIAYIKNGRYFIWNDPAHDNYDFIAFSQALAALKKGKLKGYYGLSAVKYTTLGSFDHYLAGIELPDGRKGYLDTEGNEYLNP